MSEELKSIGGDMRPEEVAVNERSVGQRQEAGPMGAVEISSEKRAETASERYAELLSKSSSQGSPAVATEPSLVEMDAKAIYDETDAEARITKLISLAEVKGVEHAVKVARKLDDFYVLDRMHDELSGAFYEALKAKGLVNGQ